MDMTSPKRSKTARTLPYVGGKRVVPKPLHVIGNTPQPRRLALAQGAGASVRPRDIRRAHDLAQEAEDIRTEKVEAARRALQNGTLNLNSEELADALLRHILPLNNTPPRH